MISSDDIRNTPLHDFEHWIDERIWSELANVSYQAISFITQPVRRDLRNTFIEQIIDFIPQEMRVKTDSYDEPPLYIDTQSWSQIIKRFCEEQKDYYGRFISRLRKAAEKAKERHQKDPSDNYQFYFYEETDKLKNVFLDVYEVFDSHWGYDADNYKQAMSIISDIEKYSDAAIKKLQEFFTQVLPKEIEQNKRYFFEMVFEESDFNDSLWFEVT